MAGLTRERRRQLIEAVDNIPKFQGYGIVYNGNLMCEIVRPSRFPPGLRTWVVISESTKQHHDQIGPDDTHNMRKEVGMLLLNCGAAFLAGTSAVISGITTPFTGGTSIPLTVLAHSAALASSLQCGDSAGRVYNEWVDSSTNEKYLDSKRWYTNSKLGLDLIGLAASAVVLPKTFKSAAQLNLKRLVKSGELSHLYKVEQIPKEIIVDLIDGIGAVFTITGSAVDGNIYNIIVHFVTEAEN